MQQRFLVLLSATLATSGALARPCTAGVVGDDWSRLDADLDALVSSQTADESGLPNLHGFVKALWANIPNELGGHVDAEGFFVDHAQLSLDGTLPGHTGYRLELEGAGGNVQVLDAYGTWDANEYLRLTAGNFRAPTIWESQLPDSELLFILRTDTGELFYTRDKGVMASGAASLFHWAVALQSGLDSIQEDPAFSAHAGVDVLGGGVGLHQGAYGAGDSPKLSFGAGYYDDQSQGDGKDGNVYALDGQLQVGRFALDALVAKYEDFTDPIFVTRSDSTPWNVAASCMVIDEKLEAAARYQDEDNVFDERDITAGINYFLHGRDAKVQVNASYIFSDDDLKDDTVRFGVAFSVRV